jgi:PTH1 family peptidyl-tRNA hydrolase
MKLIVGLGNPGDKYRNNRHNIGFMVLDRLSEKLGVKFNKEGKFNGEVAQVRTPQGKGILLKPLTYMNLSGNSVKGVVDYYKISLDQIIIVYDDLDLEAGKFRIRLKGSSGGQKGMASIIEKLGTQEIPRLRIGISKPEFQNIPDYVLSDFPKEELPLVKETIDKAAEALELFIDGSKLENIMNKYNKN